MHLGQSDLYILILSHNSFQKIILESFRAKNILTIILKSKLLNKENF